MQNNQRSAIVISALLTTLVITVIAGGMLVYNGLLPITGVSAQGGVSQTQQKEAPIVVTVQPVLAPDTQQAAPAVLPESASVAATTVSADDVAAQIADAVAAQSNADAEAIAAYQAQLEEAYRALQEAYAQIDVLQNAQAQVASAPASYNGDRERGEYRGDEGRERGEREHDDD